MNVSSILARVRSGEMSVEEGKNQVLKFLASGSQKERFQKFKKKVSQSGGHLREVVWGDSPAALASGLLKEVPRFLSQSANRFSDPLFGWLDQVSSSLKRVSSDEEEVLLKLSFLGQCDYEFDCQVKENELLVSRWCEIHFVNQSEVQNNLFQGAQFLKSEFQGGSVKFNKVKLSSFQKLFFHLSQVNRCDVDLSSLNRCEWIESQIESCEIQSSFLQEVDWTQSQFQSCSFQSCRLNKVSFQKCQMESLIFDRCVFRDSYFEGLQWKPKGKKKVIISGKDFTGCHFRSLNDFLHFAGLPAPVSQTRGRKKASASSPRRTTSKASGQKKKGKGSSRDGSPKA